MSLNNNLSVLIVEDNKDKLEIIEDKLKGVNLLNGLGGVDVSSVVSYDDFKDEFKDQHFDLIILDLSIPVNEYSDPSFDNAKALLSLVEHEKERSPFLIVGLTSYKSADYQEKIVESNVFKIFHYIEDDWVSYIKDNVQFIHCAKASLKRYFDNSYSLDVMVLVARKENEFDPIVSCVPWGGGVCEPKDSLTELNYFNRFGVIENNDGTILSLGVVCLGEMGLSSSAATTARLICDFRPRTLVMLGMCCGIRNSKMPYQPAYGDVIIAKESACWDEGKYFNDESLDDPFYFSPKIRLIEADPLKRIENILEGSYTDLRESLQKLYCNHSDLNVARDKFGNDFNMSTDVHLGMLLSGSSVIDSPSKLSDIKGRYPYATGLEMEAFSVYTAAESVGGIRPTTLVIKGVADYGDGNKCKTTQKMASEGSWTVFFELLNRTNF